MCPEALRLSSAAGSVPQAAGKRGLGACAAGAMPTERLALMNQVQLAQEKREMFVGVTLRNERKDSGEEGREPAHTLAGGAMWGSKL